MVTFRKPIGSVSVSGHKFVGAPVPCGVVITRKRYAMALSSDVEYLNSRDATIMVRSNTARGSVCNPMLRLSLRLSAQCRLQLWRGSICVSAP